MVEPSPSPRRSQQGSRVKVKVPAGPLKGLSRVDVKKRPSFLLTISQVLFHRSKSFQQIEDKKVAKMNKDLLRIVADY